MTSSYRKKMEELEADELRLKKEEEFNGSQYNYYIDTGKRPLCVHAS